MCGRFTNRITQSQYQEFFDAMRAPDLKPRFNVAPTQMIPVIRPGDRKRVVAPMSWGLVPSWAADRKIGNNLIHARADIVATKSSYRAGFKRHRRLIPVDWFYEWKQIAQILTPAAFRS